MSYERTLVELLDRTSVIDVVAIQMDIFKEQKKVDPELIQVNFQLRPAFIRDFARSAGISIDAVFGLQSLVIDKVPVMFLSMPSHEYVRIFGPGLNMQVL